MITPPAIPCRTVGELRAALAAWPDDTPVEPNDGDYILVFPPCSLHHGVILDTICDSGSWKSKTHNAPRER